MSRDEAAMSYQDIYEAFQNDFQRTPQKKKYLISSHRVHSAVTCCSSAGSSSKRYQSHSKYEENAEEQEWTKGMILPVNPPNPSVAATATTAVTAAGSCSAAKTAHLSSAKRVSFGANNAQIVLFSAGEHSNSKTMQCSSNGIPSQHHDRDGEESTVSPYEVHYDVFGNIIYDQHHELPAISTQPPQPFRYKFEASLDSITISSHEAQQQQQQWISQQTQEAGQQEDQDESTLPHFHHHDQETCPPQESTFPHYQVDEEKQLDEGLSTHNPKRNNHAEDDNDLTDSDSDSNQDYDDDADEDKENKDPLSLIASLHQHSQQQSSSFLSYGMQMVSPARCAHSRILTSCLNPPSASIKACEQQTPAQARRLEGLSEQRIGVVRFKEEEDDDDEEEGEDYENENKQCNINRQNTSMNIPEESNLPMQLSNNNTNYLQLNSNRNHTPSGAHNHRSHNLLSDTYTQIIHTQLASSSANSRTPLRDITSSAQKNKKYHAVKKALEFTSPMMIKSWEYFTATKQTTNNSMTSSALKQSGTKTAMCYNEGLNSGRLCAPARLYR